MAKFIAKIINTVILVGLLAGGFLIIERKIAKQNADSGKLSEKLMSVEIELIQLQKKLDETAKVAEEKSVIKEEIVRREIIREKSQEELLTSAVAKITPSVVSVIVTKDMPKMEIVYENPFGDDPFFKDFDIRVPVLRQKGSETQKIGAGTGFLIRPEGYLITNRHVVEDAQATYTVLLSNGTQQTAQVIYRDPNIDMAILKIPGSAYAKAELGNSDALVLGQSVFAVGNALGEYSNSVSVGIISGLNRDIEASGGNTTEKLTGVIQTDAAINPGNSGGPLVDLSGKIVGINVATVIGSNNISFSIPINKLKSVIQSVLK